MRVSNLLVASVLVAATTAATGCATVLKSKTSSVTLDGAPAGSEVIVDGKSVGQAPVSVTLSNKVSHDVVFRTADGDRSCRIEAGASTGWVVLGIAAGGVGWIVDWATGNWRSLDASKCTGGGASGGTAVSAR